MVDLSAAQIKRAQAFARGFSLTQQLTYAAAISPTPELLRAFALRVLDESIRSTGNLTLRWIPWQGVTQTLERIDPARASSAPPSDEKQILVVDLAQAQPGQLQQLRDFAARLNPWRDVLPRRLRGLMLLALPDWLERPFATAAPDLWSGVSTAWLERSDELDMSALDDWWQACDHRFDELLAHREAARDKYKYGTHTQGYIVEPGTIELPLADLRHTLQRVPGYTGWRTWWVPEDRFAPTSVDSVLECWMFGEGRMFDDPAHSDFWRASRYGELYLRRGHEEDSYPDRIQPGVAISIGLPVWRVGEALLHARDFTTMLGLRDDVQIGFRTHWTGLRDRRLTHWPERGFGSLTFNSPAVSEQATGQATFDLTRLREDLPALVASLVEPLFECFELYQPPPSFVAAELEKLLSRRS